MKPHRKRKAILGILLLAVLCISAVEFVACYYFDPELFHKITAPAVNTVEAASDAIQSAATSAGQAIEDLFARIQTAIEDEKARRAAEKLRAEQEAAEAETPEILPENQTSTPPLLNTSSQICDPAVTELRSIGDVDFLTGGPVNIVYYHQSDERWGSKKYGSDKISTHGCGPTAMAMVVSSLTDTIITPEEMAAWAVDHGYWAKRSGSYHSIVLGTAAAFDLQAEAYTSRSAEALRETLMTGDLLVALMGPGHFTQSGHFIILRGVTLSGDILVADPGSPDRSLTAWDAQLLLDELSKSTADGSPLWLISGAKTYDIE